MARIAFLYTWDWSKEKMDFLDGIVPSHRLFGAMELAQHNHAVTMIEKGGRFSNFVRSGAHWKVFQAFKLIQLQKQLDVIVCTHESSALPVLILRRLKLIRTPIVFMNVALLEPRNLRGLRQKLWQQALRGCGAVISFASAQLAWISQEFGVDESVLHFIRFGVDTKFFPPTVSKPSFPYFFSAGTNAGKDFATLVKSLPENAKLIVATDEFNRRIIRESSGNNNVVLMHDVPILQLRQLYANAIAVIVPLHATKFSSGQTVLLECMAMGKELVVTETSAVKDYLCEGVRTYAPGDHVTLRRHLVELMNNDQARVPNQALVDHVQNNCSSEIFGHELSKLINSIV